MHISLAAEPLFHIGSFTVTNSLLISWLVIAFLAVFALLVKRKIALVPKGLQNLVESVFEALLDLVDSITQNRKQSIKFFPVVATIFLFVILANWAGLLPGMGTIGLNEEVHGEQVLVPFIRAGSADLNFTLGLAIVSVMSVQIFGIAAIGFKKYAGKFFVSPFKKPIFIGTFVGLLEVMSEISRLLSYSFRLFGNIFAGEILLTVMLFLVPYFVPLPFLMLEIFVGFVQALVFSVLTLVFMKMATLEHEH